MTRLYLKTISRKLSHVLLGKCKHGILSELSLDDEYYDVAGWSLDDNVETREISLLILDDVHVQQEVFKS